jgi:hypothetical protein
MRWLIWRETVVALRTKALWAAIGGHAAVLSAFVIVWGDGVPVFADRSVFEQFGAVEGFVLTLLLPWVAARCLGGDSRDLAKLALMTAARPSRVIVARCIAGAVVLGAVVASAWPLAAVALQISARPLGQLLRILPGLAIVCSFVAVVTTACMLTSGSRLAGWLLATLVTAAAAYLGPSLAVATVMAVLVVVLAWGLARWADTNWQYLEDAAHE